MLEELFVSNIFYEYISRHHYRVNMNFHKRRTLILFLRNCIQKRRQFRQRMNYIVQEYNRHRRLRQMAYLLSDSMIFAERSYWMTRYHQNWFENIWAIREVQIVKELGPFFKMILTLFNQSSLNCFIPLFLFFL